jgi:hypothetical protein
MSIEKEIRKEFEVWAKACPREFDLKIHGEASAWHGNYFYYNVQCAWEAWLAAKTTHKLASLPAPTMHYDTFSGRRMPYYRSDTVESILMDLNIPYTQE